MSIIWIYILFINYFSCLKIIILMNYWKSYGNIRRESNNNNNELIVVAGNVKQGGAQVN
jgi:hypothetical protein